MITEYFTKDDSALDKSDSERFIIDTKDGVIELLKHQVLFGYRLKAGYVDEMVYDLDICCGDRSIDYDMMFEKICTIVLSNIKQNKYPFQSISPHSKVKPYFNDVEFQLTIQTLYNQAKSFLND